MEIGIALFVYNRAHHIQMVLDGLRANGVEKIYVFADGPKYESHVKDINEVSTIINSIDWCEVEYIKSKVNKGLANSIVDGINYVLERHERIIVLEDDCIPSNDFVYYMNQCFEKYEEDKQVMSISGYSFPIDLPKSYEYDVYFTKRISSWGWGTWRRAWNSFSRNRTSINDSILLSRIYDYAPDLVDMFNDQLNGELDSWAIYWALNVIENDGVCINPIHSKILNVGNDGSGVHCDSTNKYDVELHNTLREPLNFPKDKGLNSEITNGIARFFYQDSFKSYLRIKRYYEIMVIWMANVNAGMKISNYLDNKGIKNVAIYGIGKIGKQLYYELKKDGYPIKYLIDSNSKKINREANSFGTATLDEAASKNDFDAIIVTPIYDYENIYSKIDLLNLGKEIISLENIIFSMKDLE